MSGLDIEAIRKRWERASSETQPLDMHHLAASAADVPALLAEIKKLREWNDEIKAERDQLALTHLDVEALRRQLEEARAERDEARAALADALQVIADLRGVS